jgi:hypothetical protein
VYIRPNHTRLRTWTKDVKQKRNLTSYEATLVSFEYTPTPTKKKELFSREINLKIPLFIYRVWCGLTLKSKPRCRVSALQFFVRLIPPMAFWHRAHSDKCFFSFLFHDQPLFYCWKVNISHNLQKPEKDHLHSHCLYLWLPNTSSYRTSQAGQEVEIFMVSWEDWEFIGYAYMTVEYYLPQDLLLCTLVRSGHSFKGPVLYNVTLSLYICYYI